MRDLADRGTDVTRLVLTPSALAPEMQPEAILMRARRLGLPTSRLPSLDEGGEALQLAPVKVEDLLLRPSVKIDYEPARSLRRAASPRSSPAAAARSARKSATGS